MYLVRLGAYKVNTTFPNCAGCSEYVPLLTNLATNMLTEMGCIPGYNIYLQGASLGVGRGSLGNELTSVGDIARIRGCARPVLHVKPHEQPLACAVSHIGYLSLVLELLVGEIN